MGSLPNLSEIGREDESPIAYRAAPPPEHGYFPRGAPMSFRNERCKIRYRQSERGDLARPKRKPLALGPPPIKWVPFDDLALQVGALQEKFQQHTATSSPASARSTNFTHVVRRRDSLSSSIGATSVRRLISVVRNSHHRPGRHYNKRVFLRLLLMFCASHLFLNAAFLPFVVLQSSVSAWTLPFRDSALGADVGSCLLAVMYALAAASALLGPCVVHRLGVHALLLLSYSAFSVFFAAHLYPALYILVPAYVFLGLVLGLVSLTSITFVMGLSTKMSCAMSEDDDELRVARRTVIIRRFARAIQAAQDLGLIFGSFVAAFFIMFWQPAGAGCDSPEPDDCSPCKTCTACPLNATHGALRNCSEGALADYVSFVDNFFDVDDHGQRLCGASACASFLVASNSSSTSMLPRTTSVLLASTLVGFALVSLVTAGLGLGKLKTYVSQDVMEGTHFLVSLRAVRDSFKDSRLQLAAPLSMFIGMEQAFLYSDFSKSYVVCILGTQHLNLVFMAMGVLQSIAACTLSMLLKSIQRYYVVCVGFIFQCCVLMVQMLWKPINDDPALFYVIPAVWGVCNAIWEILMFSLLTKLYAENWSAPFCNSTFFRFAGLAVSFAIHGFLCNWIKLYILAVFMLVAVFPFLWLEIRLSRLQKGHDASRL